MANENIPRAKLPRITVGTTLNQEETDRLDQMAQQYGGNRSMTLRAALVCYDRMLMAQNGVNAELRESVFELLLEKPG